MIRRLKHTRSYKQANAKAEYEDEYLNDLKELEDGEEADGQNWNRASCNQIGTESETDGNKAQKSSVLLPYPKKGCRSTHS